LEHNNGGPQVRLAGNKLVTLTVTEEVQDAYMLIRWSVGTERGLSKLDELAPPGGEPR
jgi:hypothetical protein